MEVQLVFSLRVSDHGVYSGHVFIAVETLETLRGPVERGQISIVQQ